MLYSMINVCLVTFRSEEERDLWTKKLQAVISDASSRRQTCFYEDFYDQNIPKFYPDPEIKSVFVCVMCIVVYIQHVLQMLYAS